MYIYTVVIRKKYDQIIAKVHQERAKKVNKFLQTYEGQVPQDIQELIINSTACQLFKLMESGKITSEQIVITFSLRICQVSLNYNFVADVNFDEAIEQARVKDQERRDLQKENQLLSIKKSLKPLHGLPIAIKDHIRVKGFYCTDGLAYKAKSKCNKDSAFVAALRKQGAIFICMTTEPQFAGHYTNESRIWGVGVNPYNKDFSCGGSSGGAAGIIAIKSHPLSIGSDLGGSIRIPASWCGVYGFKPTNFRISKRFAISPNPFVKANNDREIGVSFGPIGRCVDDLILVCKSVFGQFDCDPLKNILPWNQKQFDQFDISQLRIGYVDQSKIFPFVNPVKNVMMEIVQKLKESEKYELIQFDFDRFIEMDLLIKQIIVGKCPKNFIQSILKGEKPFKWGQMYQAGEYLPQCLKNLASFILKFSTNNEYLSKIVKLGKITYSEAVQVQQQLDQLIYSFFDYWRQLNLDVLILPNSSFFIAKHGEDNLNFLPSYWFMTNTMKMPVGVVPIRLCKEEEQSYDCNRQDFLTQEIRKTVKNCKNLPIAVQVCTLPYEDEKCLKIMKHLENIFQFNNFPN